MVFSFAAFVQPKRYYFYKSFQVQGRLEGGQLYTPAYVSRITAMVRGATRGLTVPTNLPSVWNSLQQQLQEMHGANGVSVEGSFFQSIFVALLKEGAVLGSVRAGVHWTPAVSSAFQFIYLIRKLCFNVVLFFLARYLLMLKRKALMHFFHRLRHL